MSQLVVLLLLFIADCTAQRNSSDAPSFCEEYAECMTLAHQKAAECHEENTTTVVQSGRKQHCQGVLELHSQLQALHSERDVEVTTCVRHRAVEALTLNSRKTEKCKATLKKTKRSTPIDAADHRLKRKMKKDKKDKMKSCTKEAKKLRMHCGKLGKCCSVVKDCHQHVTKRNEIAEKKKQLKKLYEACHSGHSKKIASKPLKEENEEKTAKDKSEKRKQQQLGKNGNLNEKMEASTAKKLSASVSTKVLAETAPVDV